MELSSYFSATSEPKGPVYLWARREVMEAEADKDDMITLPPRKPVPRWQPLEPAGLSPKGVYLSLKFKFSNL